MPLLRETLFISLWIFSSFWITMCLEWKVKTNAPTTVPGNRNSRNITSASFPSSNLMWVFLLGQRPVWADSAWSCRESGNRGPEPHSPGQGSHTWDVVGGVEWSLPVCSACQAIVSGPLFSETLVNLLKASWQEPTLYQPNPKSNSFYSSVYPCFTLKVKFTLVTNQY